jgi:hypothetical protein
MAIREAPRCASGRRECLGAGAAFAGAEEHDYCFRVRSLGGHAAFYVARQRAATPTAAVSACSTSTATSVIGWVADGAFCCQAPDDALPVSFGDRGPSGLNSECKSER